MSGPAWGKGAPEVKGTFLFPGIWCGEVAGEESPLGPLQEHSGRPPLAHLPWV